MGLSKAVWALATVGYVAACSSSGRDYSNGGQGGHSGASNDARGGQTNVAAGGAHSSGAAGEATETGGRSEAGAPSTHGGVSSSMGGQSINGGGPGNHGGAGGSGPSSGGANQSGGAAPTDAGASGNGNGNGGEAGGEGGATNPGVVAPTRVGSAQFHDSASGDDQASGHLADAVFTLPSGVTEGDFMLVFFGADHSLHNMTGNFLESIGWTLLDQLEDFGTDGQATYLLYRFATGTEAATITFPGINDTPSGVGVQGLLAVYRGVNAQNPINAYETHLDDTGNDSSIHVTTETPAITTTVAGCLAIAGLSPDTRVDAPLITTWPAGFDDNRTSVINPAHPYPYGWANIYDAEQRLPKAGTLPASAFAWDITYGGSEYDGAMSFVLALAPR